VLDKYINPNLVYYKHNGDDEPCDYYLILDRCGFFPVSYQGAGRTSGAAECWAVGGDTMIISYDKFSAFNTF